jgi:hypothetical protein
VGAPCGSPAPWVPPHGAMALGVALRARSRSAASPTPLAREMANTRLARQRHVFGSPRRAVLLSGERSKNVLPKPGAAGPPDGAMALGVALRARSGSLTLLAREMASMRFARQWHAFLSSQCACTTRTLCSNSVTLACGKVTTTRPNIHLYFCDNNTN